MTSTTGRIAEKQVQSATVDRNKIVNLIKRVLFVVLLVGCTIIFLAPLLWLISASLKVRSDVFSLSWIPDPIAWENYRRVWEAAPLFTWLKNSVIVGALAGVSVTISSSLVAFGFATFRFPGRNFLFGLVLATMMLPGAVTMIPVFLVWDALGFINTLVPLWAGNLFGSAFYIFLMRQFYLTLPKDLFEAARVDGANFFQIWWRIAAPLTKTAMIVVFIFELKASWTDLIKPLIYLQNSALFTMPRGLKAILDQFGQGGELQWEIIMAATVIMTIPMIAIFFMGQRYFIEGLTTTGMKG